MFSRVLVIVPHFKRYFQQAWWQSSEAKYLKSKVPCILGPLVLKDFSLALKGGTDRGSAATEGRASNEVLVSGNIPFLEMVVKKYNHIVTIKHINCEDYGQRNVIDLKLLIARSHESQYLGILQELVNMADTTTHTQDRTGTGVYKTFVKHMKFDLREGLPLITTKKLFLKGVIAELDLFLSGKTDSKILESQGINIWKPHSSKEWLSKSGLVWREGDMGPMYGHSWRHFGAEYKGCDVDYTGQGIDQIQQIVDMIKKEPHSRRLCMTTWNPSVLHQMALPPCHGLITQFSIQDEFLDCFSYQRSGDMFLGVPFNLASYALLMRYIAAQTDKIPRYMNYTIGDAHLYRNHVEQAKEQLTRTPFAAVDNIEDYVSWDVLKGDMAL